MAMAGPAIRAVELCRRLAGKHEVTLACPGVSQLANLPFQAVELGEGKSLGPLFKLLRPGDAFVAQGFGFPLRDLGALPAGVRVVLDLYDPVQLELLARYGGKATPGQRVHLVAVRRRLLHLLTRADHVLCASERQRAFWLGWLGACGRLTPEALANDPEGRALLAVVPFGIGAQPPPPFTIEGLGGASPAPESAEAAAAGMRPPHFVPRTLISDGHAPGELPVLWWGGLWDWMDPVTAVRAIDRLRKKGVPAALVLPAGNRPGAEPMAAAAQAIDEAKARGLWGAGRGVAQLDGWIPYAHRRGALDAAAVALSCHRPSLEAELAFRTRLLDCVWAALPAVATAGDELSARAEREGWALAPPAGDVDAVAAALQDLLKPDRLQAAREAARRVREDYSWDRSAATLAKLLERSPTDRRAAPGWGFAGRLVPEAMGAPPLQVAGAVAGKLLSKARKLRGNR